jgi:hypothetical protein
MTIHLRTTPSLRGKRMTKGQRELLEQVNAERRKNGEKPLTTLKTPKLDKKNFRSTNSLPNYSWNPRGASTAHIPSRIHDAPADAHSTGRNTVMDKVHRGEITGKDADEVIRKRCSTLATRIRRVTQVRKYETYNCSRRTTGYYCIISMAKKKKARV